MFRLLVVVLLCLIFRSSSDDSSYWPQVSKVEVTVLCPCCYICESEIRFLINRYGDRHGITSDDMQFRLVEKCRGKYYAERIAKVEVHIPQCNEFRKYLLHAGRFIPDIQMIHVKCDRAHYSHCLKYNCKGMDYVELTKCAYNNTI